MGSDFRLVGAVRLRAGMQTPLNLYRKQRNDHWVFSKPGLENAETHVTREPSDGGVAVTRSSGRPLSGLSLDRPSASARNVEARNGRPLRARDRVTGVMPHASANSRWVSPPRATSSSRGAGLR